MKQAKQAYNQIFKYIWFYNLQFSPFVSPFVLLIAEAYDGFSCVMSLRAWALSRPLAEQTSCRGRSHMTRHSRQLSEPVGRPGRHPRMR